MRDTGFDNDQAVAEGWILNERSGDDVRYAIEKLDDPSEHQGNTGRTFRSDDDAAAYVVRCARAGSAYHKAALLFLEEHSPVGWDWAVYAADHLREIRLSVPAGSRPRVPQAA